MGVEDNHGRPPAGPGQSAQSPSPPPELAITDPSEALAVTVTPAPRSTSTLSGTPPPSTTVDDFDGEPKPRARAESLLDQIVTGTRIHHYELIRELGRGGMGVVWVARDTTLGRRVAIKFLHGTSRDVAERFLVEARATAQCSHENIVIVHQVDVYRDIPYMVLELLEGTSLRALIGSINAGTRMLPSRVVELMLPVARALARAHELGIVHRDLKPENVFVTTTGTVKVLDFGIAKALGSLDPTRVPRIETAPTLQPISNADIVGTLPYMAPEQFDNDDVDHRVDLWALGIMMFEMLAGQHPVVPLTAAGLIDTVTSDEPMTSLRSVVPDVPPRLAMVVDTCLFKAREKRLAHASDLIQRLEQLHRPTRGEPPLLNAIPLVISSPARGDAGLTIKRTEIPGATRLTVSGVIDASFELALSGTAPGVLVLDLSGVRRITSFGVRAWILALGESGASYIGFVGCRPSLVTQFNQVANFACRGEIVSLYLPYLCASCGAPTERLLDLRTKWDVVAKDAIPPLVCEGCGGQTEFDDIPDDYFSFTSMQSRPTLPAIGERLLSGSDDKFRVKKEIQDRITALWMTGALDSKIRFHRVVDGLEGVVLVVASGITRVDADLAYLTSLTEIPGVEAYFARVPEFILRTLSLAHREKLAGRVVSAMMQVECSGCHSSPWIEVDAVAIGTGATPPCPTCGAAPIGAIDTDAASDIRPLLATQVLPDVVSYLAANSAVAMPDDDQPTPPGTLNS